MGHVDLRGRREESARKRRGPASPWRVVEYVPYLFAGLGMVLALPALAASWAALSNNSSDWRVALVY